MKTKIFTFVAAAFLAATMISSCATVNNGASISNAPLGQKVGEAKSNIYLGLWSSKGEEANLKKACENGGITRINQVEYENQAVLFGVVVKRTTRVYGE